MSCIAIAFSESLVAVFLDLRLVKSIVNMLLSAYAASTEPSDVRMLRTVRQSCNTEHVLGRTVLKTLQNRAFSKLGVSENLAVVLYSLGKQ
jgi:hypothetical protein